MSGEIEDEVFGDTDEVVVQEKVKIEPTWYCVHCQRPTPKRLSVVYDGARVCRDPACVKFVILQDGYARAGSVLSRHTKNCLGKCDTPE